MSTYRPTIGDIVTFDDRNLPAPECAELVGYPFRVTAVDYTYVSVTPIVTLPPHRFTHFNNFYHYRFKLFSRPLYRRS